MLEYAGSWSAEPGWVVITVTRGRRISLSTVATPIRHNNSQHMAAKHAINPSFDMLRKLLGGNRGW